MDSDRENAHERAVSVRELIVPAGKLSRNARFNPIQSARGRYSNIENSASGSPDFLAAPSRKALAEVGSVEACFNEAIDGAQKQRGIIGPRAGRLAMGSKSPHAGNGIGFSDLS